MKLNLLTHRLHHLLHQRNALMVLVAALLALNGVQALTLCFNNERLVVMPPTLNREVWVENNRVSAAYLEEMALFLSTFMLEISPESVAYKRDIILRHTVNESYGALKVKLLEDERRLKKERVITSFQPNAVKVTPATLTVEVTGDLMRFVGEKRLSQSRDTYAFTFVYRNGRLLIQSFQLIGSDKND